MASTSLFEVVIRADTSPEIGGGHLMRCLALAGTLREAGGGVRFLCQDLLGSTAVALLDQAGFEIDLLPPGTADRDAAETIAILQARGTRPDWLVVDHYDLCAVWQRALAPYVGQILAIEDVPGRTHVADILLDPTFGRLAEVYAGFVPEDCQLLLGADYALLRPEFSTLRPAALARRETQAAPERLLISLGSGDTSDDLLTVLAALAEPGLTAGLEVTLVLGGRQAKEDQIRAAAAALPAPVEILDYAGDMPALMAGSDLAIGAAGGATWERCCLGLPSVVLKLSDNQADIAQTLSGNGAAIPSLVDPGAIAGSLRQLLLDQEVAKRMSEAAARMCDGKGVYLLRHQMLQRLFTLRPATSDDAAFIWQARYGGGGAKDYRNPDVPSMAEHVAWLNQALAEPGRVFWVAEISGQAVGHVRLDLDQPSDRTAELSLYIAPDRRGAGLGQAMLTCATQAAFARGIEIIHAEVQARNLASVNSFLKAGYRECGGSDTGFVLFQAQHGTLEYGEKQCLKI